MKRMILGLLIVTASAFALDKDYKAGHPLCTTKENLETWLIADKDTKRAMYGKKCYVLGKDIPVTKVDTSFMSGIISFYLKDEQFYGIREGIW